MDNRKDKRVSLIIVTCIFLMSLTFMCASWMRGGLMFDANAKGISYAVDEFFVFTHVDVYVNEDYEWTQTKGIEESVRESVMEQRLGVFKVFPIAVDIHHLEEYSSETTKKVE